MSSSEEVGVIKSVSREGRRFAPPAAAKSRALLDEATYERMYTRSVEEPEAFWAEQAEAELTWTKKWDRVLDWQPPYARWFDGGELNDSANCLDRQLEKRGDKTAILWEGESGEIVKLSFVLLNCEVGLCLIVVN